MKSFDMYRGGVFFSEEERNVDVDGLMVFFPLVLSIEKILHR